MKPWILLAAGVVACSAITPCYAGAQTLPQPAPSLPAAPAATTTADAAPDDLSTAAKSPAAADDLVTGPTFGTNDPCTSIDAIANGVSDAQAVCTVRPKHVMLENNYENDSSAGQNYVIYPNSIVRIGLPLPKLEFDLGLPGQTRINAGGVTSGSSDFGVGLKYVLGYTPKLSYGAGVFFALPTGKPGFTGGDCGAGIQTYNFNLGYSFNSVLSAFGTIGVWSQASVQPSPVNPNITYSQRYSSFQNSWGLNAALPYHTSLYVEGSYYTNGGGAETAPYRQLLLGVIKDLNPRTQLNFTLGRAIGGGPNLNIVIGGLSYYL